MGVWLKLLSTLGVGFVFGAVNWLEGEEVAWVEDALTNGTLRNGFSTYSETKSVLDNAAREYPHLLTRFTIGKSYEDRPIDAYLLSRNPIISEFHSSNGPGSLTLPPEVPQILLTALHHAREPASLSVVVYCLLRLIAESEKAEVHPVVQHILDNVAIVAVPFVNPDGYVAMEAMHNYSIRKNRRPTCQNSVAPELDGVDLNRNYAYHYKIEHHGCDPEEYEGESAFSEPETQAIRSVAEANKFRVALNFHAYGGSWTHPYNCCNDTELSAEVTDVLQELKSILNVKQFERAPRVESLLYTTTGEADDWFLSELNVLSLSPEVGWEKDGFWPPKSAILPICRRNFERIIDIAIKCDTELSSFSTHIRLPDLLSNPNDTVTAAPVPNPSSKPEFLTQIVGGDNNRPIVKLNVPLARLSKEALRSYTRSKQLENTRVSDNPESNSVIKDIIIYNSGLSGANETFFLALFRTEEPLKSTPNKSVGAYVPRWSFMESGDSLGASIRRLIADHTALVYAEKEKSCSYILLDADGVPLPNVDSSDNDAELLRRLDDSAKEPLMFRMPSMLPRSSHVVYLYSPDLHCVQVLSSLCVVQSPERASYDPQRAQYEALATCHCGAIETPNKFFDINSYSEGLANGNSTVPVEDGGSTLGATVPLSVPLTEWNRAALHIQKPSSDGRCRAATRWLFFSEPSAFVRVKSFAAWSNPQVLVIGKGYFASVAFVAAIFEVLLLLLAGGCCLRIAWELFLDNESGLKPFVRNKCVAFGKWIDFVFCCLKAFPFLRKKTKTTVRPRRRSRRSPRVGSPSEESGLKGKPSYGRVGQTTVESDDAADDHVELVIDNTFDDDMSST
eukprot:Lankesteria_metandrocarpae@DN2647_c0_g1_i2.p1